jgi:hypothetical protein
MCDIPPLPGWNGLVIEVPSGDGMWMWLLLLAPFILPPLSYLLRPLTEVQNAFALPPFRLGPVSSTPPTLRWYAIQTALLFIAICTLVFVALPSDRLWRAWQLQAQTTVGSECQSAVEAMSSTYLNSSGMVALVGVGLPGVIFVLSVLYVTYARRYPHP